jgi:hypothetical protein
MVVVGLGASTGLSPPTEAAVKGLLAVVKGAAVLVGVVKGLAGEAGSPNPLLAGVEVVVEGAAAGAVTGAPQLPNPLPPVNPVVVPVGAEIPENNPAFPAGAFT